MRQVTFISFLLLLFVSCNNNTEQIRQTAQGYLDAMGNYNPTEARAYATEETCDSTLTFFEDIMKNVSPEIYANNIPAKITITEIAIDGKTATATFHKSTPSVQQDGSITLLKRHGQWKVHQIINIPPMLNPNKKHERKPLTVEEIHKMKPVNLSELNSGRKDAPTNK